ncbi:MAG TPA: hypothetical protein VN847_14090, partial [Streptosporangiaceae bacterium]|nr:hypothetical protein [Streptosporangiaceae bacterium]
FNDVVRLIDSMKRVGVDHQAAALAERLPAAGGFAPFQKHLKSRFRYGREPDGRPSEKWTWDDLS